MRVASLRFSRCLTQAAKNPSDLLSRLQGSVSGKPLQNVRTNVMLGLQYYYYKYVPMCIRTYVGKLYVHRFSYVASTRLVPLLYVLVSWLRTNGVNTNGAAAKVMNLTDWGKRYALALLEIHK